MHRGSGTIEPSDYFLLVLLLLPQDISAAWRVSARGQTHRLQPLRMLQRDESHRLLLFCRSIVSFCTDTSRTLTGAIATATWQMQLAACPKLLPLLAFSHGTPLVAACKAQMRLLRAPRQWSHRFLGLSPAGAGAAAPRYLSTCTIYAGSPGICGCVACLLGG